MGRVIVLRDISEARRRDSERELLQEIRDQLWQMEQSSDMPIEFSHCGLNMIQEPEAGEEIDVCFLSMSLDRNGQPVTATDESAHSQHLADAWGTRTARYRADLSYAGQLRRPRVDPQRLWRSTKAARCALRRGDIGSQPQRTKCLFSRCHRLAGDEGTGAGGKPRQGRLPLQHFP
jgi:hypothetical protein